MTRSLCLLLAAALPFLTAGAAPQSPASGAVASTLADAQAALAAGDYQGAAGLSGPITSTTVRLAREDRAEAWRIYGLALFFLGQHTQAEEALLEFLKLDVDAHLDPTLVPPEAIVFFEDVRVRHAAELRTYRPEPEIERSIWWSLLPPAGQFFNGDRTKGWVLGAAEGTLLAANVGAFLLFRQNCGVACQNPDQARVLRAVNFATAVGLAGVVIYGIADGYLQHPSRSDRSQEAPMSVGVGPTRDGASLSLRARF